MLDNTPQVTPPNTAKFESDIHAFKQVRETTLSKLWSSLTPWFSGSTISLDGFDLFPLEG